MKIPTTQQFWTLLITLVLAMPAPLALGEDASSIGYVDIRKALETVEAGKTAKQTLESEVKAKQAELEKQKAGFQKELESFEKRAAILSEAKKAEGQAAIQKKYADLQKAMGESQAELQNRDRALTEPIINELKGIIEGLAKEKKIGLVIERNEGGVLYAQESQDLTAATIERFNLKNKDSKDKKKKK